MRELMDRIAHRARERERGYAVVYEAGTSAIAAVICRPGDRQPVGTVSMAGPSIRVTAERLPLLSPAVQQCAQRLPAISARSAAFSKH